MSPLTFDFASKRVWFLDAESNASIKKLNARIACPSCTSGPFMLNQNAEFAGFPLKLEKLNRAFHFMSGSCAFAPIYKPFSVNTVV